MTFDYSKAVAAAAAQVNMNEAQQGGGGDYTPPAAGLARLRFVGYIEVGKQETNFKGQPKIEEQAQLVFELSGPKHQPNVTADGTKIPQRIAVTLNKSLSEKSHFYKLFRKMNYDGTATHIAQLLGRAYLGTVVHDEWEKDGKKMVSAKLRDDVGYTIRAPRVEDPETGEVKEVKVDEPLSEIRCFLWDYPSKEMWASIFIEGEYPERKDEKTGKVIATARSKNVLQAKIQKALNWVGSPMHALLNGGDVLAAAAAAETTPAPAADEADPLGAL